MGAWIWRRYVVVGAPPWSSKPCAVAQPEAFARESVDAGLAALRSIAVASHYRVSASAMPAEQLRDEPDEQEGRAVPDRPGTSSATGLADGLAPCAFAAWEVIVGRSPPSLARLVPLSAPFGRLSRARPG